MVPPLLVLTDRREAGEAGHDLVDVVAAAVDAGAPVVVLREKDLPRTERFRLATRVRTVTAAAGATLVVASDVAMAIEVGADGVHLAAVDPRPGADLLAARWAAWASDPAAGRAGIGRSCHTVAELRSAAADPVVDHATYSPVLVTTSKPGYGPALGFDGLAAGCTAARTGAGALAVYGLGGIEPGRAGACRLAGAAGVAVMGAVMRASDPAAVVRALLAEWDEAAVRAAAGGSRSARTADG